MVFTVFCSEMTMATRCSFLEGSLTLLAIFRTVSAVRLSVSRMWTLRTAENVLVGGRGEIAQMEKFWINTVIDILKSLRKVPVHGKQTLSLGRTF